MYLFELQLIMAVLLDLCLGDPRWLPHPVQLIGYFCVSSERITRKKISSELFAGSVCFILVLVNTVSLITGILLLLNLYSSFFAQLVAIILLYTCLAARGLIAHSLAVYKALNRSEALDSARTAVAQIVGRDTSQLDRLGIIRACVETVAENMVDGVTAPLFYAVLFSLFSPLTGIDPLFLATIGAMGYKTVNTMDSMFGYKNKKYLYFGRTAAIIDDIVNWIPARISGVVLIPAAFFLGLDWKNAFIVFRRDRLAHASPNAAHSESAVAGALRIELGGTSVYFGKEMVKPAMGYPHRELESKDIIKTNHLMLMGSFLFLLSMLFCRLLIVQIIQ